MNILIKILIIILFISGAVFFVLNQRKNIKEWLLYAVVEAEKNLGSKTGKIKLRQVYDEFIRSLIEMKKILDSNTTISQYVNGIKL